MDFVPGNPLATPRELNKGPNDRPMDFSFGSLASVLRGAGRALPGVCVLLLSGCLWNIPPSSATPGFLGNDVGCPNWMEDFEVASIPYDPADIEIVGWVQDQAASTGIYGNVPGYVGSQAVSEEESNFGAVIDRLMKDNDLDGLLNPVVDTRYWAFDLYVIEFSRVRTHVGGIGYRFRRAEPDPESVGFRGR